MATRLDKEEQVFRNDLVFIADAKAVKLDSTLTNLFMLIRHDGRRVKSRMKGEHSVERLVDFMKKMEASGEFSGISGNEEAATAWLRSDLANFVFRGNVAKEKITALRPMHLETYRLRNPKYTRDYFTAEQIYSLLKVKPHVLGALKDFLAKGFDEASKHISTNEGLDLDTVALLHLAKAVQIDVRSNSRPLTSPPVLTRQAELFCDDVLRLLNYQRAIPRGVMIEYLKILIGFHLSLYTYKLIRLLPKMVEAGTRDVVDDWSLVVDASPRLDSPIEKLASEDLSRTFNGLNDYFRATFKINATQMRYRGRVTTIDELLGLIANPPSDTEVYYEIKLTNIFGKFEAGEEDEAEQLRQYIRFEADNFSKYVTILLKERGPYQLKYYQDFMANVAMNNSDFAFMAGGRSQKHPKRTVLGAKLLEVLVQLAVLEPRSGAGGYETRALSVGELITRFRKRYGLIVDGTREERFSNAGPVEQLAFRANVEALKDKLRQIGFYTDLSDAGNLQKIRARYNRG